MLQNRGHLTAMTGDGVNDAPSLKRADCGIAVEGASDAARSAADVVFLDEGLSTIITSIKVARQIFHRMKGMLFYASLNFAPDYLSTQRHSLHRLPYRTLSTSRDIPYHLHDCPQRDHPCRPHRLHRVVRRLGHHCHCI